MKLHRLTIKESFLLFWGWLWRICITINAVITGCFLYAFMNDKLQTFDSRVYGTWMWDAFTILYFAVLIGALIFIWAIWYRK